MVLAAHASQKEINDQDEEETLERCVECICQWVQTTGVLPEASTARVRRVTAHCLVDTALIVEAVQTLAPEAYKAQSTAFLNGAPPEDIAAACLRAGFKSTYGVDVNAEGLVQKAIQAGLADFEPLRDIVELWRHILCFAVCGEGKEEHIAAIMDLPADLQDELKQSISDLEQRFANPSDKLGTLARSPKSSLTGNEAKTRVSDAASNSQSPTPCSPDDMRVGGQDRGSIRDETLLQENVRLKLQVQELREHAEKFWQVRQRSSSVLDGEFETFERSWNMEKQLMERDEKIKELEQQVRTYRRSVDEVQQLREQVQLGLVVEQENKALSARMERYNERLNEAGDLKNQLDALRKQSAAVTAERDTLVQEVDKLRSSAQQLEAWRTKVLNLEMECSQAKADAQAAGESLQTVEAEKQLAEDEARLLEDRLHQAELREAFLREGGGLSSQDGGIVEPFTQELRDRMTALESQNALLEQQVSAGGSARCAELVVETQNLAGLKSHFEQQYLDAQQKLEAAEEMVNQKDQELNLLTATHRGLCEILQSTEESLQQERQNAEALQEEAASAADQCSELQHQLEELEEKCNEDFAKVQQELATEQEEQLKVTEVLAATKEQLDAQSAALRQEREERRRLERDLVDLKANTNNTQVHISTLTEGERLLREENRELQMKLSHCIYEQTQVLRRGAVLADREEVWEKKHGDLIAKLGVLEQGLRDQLDHSNELARQNALYESSLRHVAPEELERIEEAKESGTQSIIRPSLCPESEASRLRRENRRLQAALAEERLRSADGSRQVAQTAAKLRQLERMNEQRALQEKPLQANSEDAKAPEYPERVVFAELNVESAACGNKRRDSEDSIKGPSITSPEEGKTSHHHVERAGDSTRTATGGAPSGPRQSILKKPKFSDPTTAAAIGKENGAKRVKEVQSIVARRFGLIGSM